MNSITFFLMKAVTLKMLLEVDQFIYTQHSLAPLLGSNSSIQTHNLCTWMIWQSGNLLYWNKMHLYVYVSMWRGFNVDRHFFFWASVWTLVLRGESVRLSTTSDKIVLFNRSFNAPHVSPHWQNSPWKNSPNMTAP